VSANFTREAPAALEVGVQRPSKKLFSNASQTNANLSQRDANRNTGGGAFGGGSNNNRFGGFNGDRYRPNQASGTFASMSMKSLT
jgi:hypothetical protein